MTTPTVVLIAAVAAFGGYLVGGVLIPYLNSRHVLRQTRDNGLTMSQVLDLIVLAAHSGIAVVDQFHDVVLFNPRAEELGLVRGRSLDDRAWKAATRVLETGDHVEVDLTVLDARGRAGIAVKGHAQLLSQEDRRFVVLFADDDSEQVRMEATRRDFVANVSHELKTPVGAISLLAEALLQSRDDPESVQRFGERMLDESTRLGNMVSELISLSRLQGAEKLPISTSSTSTPWSRARSRVRLSRPRPRASSSRRTDRADSRCSVIRPCWSPHCPTSSRTPSRTPRRGLPCR